MRNLGWLQCGTLALTTIFTVMMLRLMHHAIFPSDAVHIEKIAEKIVSQPRISDDGRFKLTPTIIEVSSAEKLPTRKPESMNSISSVAKQVSWNTFVNTSKKAAHLQSTPPLFSLTLGYDLLTCSQSIVERLRQPALQKEDIAWCLWATDAQGGAVVVGKSWGKLNSPDHRKRFDALNCNSVSPDRNPTCDDAWGDSHIWNWQKRRNHAVQCNTKAGATSNITCIINDSKSKFCVLENVMIDFSKAKKIVKGSSVIPSKKFLQDYMSVDCHAGEREPGFTFPHLLSPSLLPTNKKVCGYVIEDTVLLYSHDNIRNMAHTLNDVMNVWVMLWLDRSAADISNIHLLTIDALKMYNNFDDVVNQYFTTYQHNFKSILRGVDFGQGTLCLRRVLTQPLPSRGFVWDNWHDDLPCSFVGPSSLFQRWNLHVRHSHGLLSKAVHDKYVQKPLKVVLIVRTESKNDWGSYRTSRLFLNQKEITNGIEKLQNSLSNSNQKFDFVVQDFAQLTFEGQMQLMSETNILIGMHGAGISQSQYMPIGFERCCGVLEMFPKGEFTPVRGFANMIRKMGLSYDRIDIPAENSLSHGAAVPVEKVVSKLKGLIDKVVGGPACVLPQVIEDPFLLRTN